MHLAPYRVFDDGPLLLIDRDKVDELTGLCTEVFLSVTFAVLVRFDLECRVFLHTQVVDRFAPPSLGSLHDEHHGMTLRSKVCGAVLEGELLSCKNGARVRSLFVNAIQEKALTMHL